MSKGFERERIIDWLEQCQANGEFDGQVEANMNFRKLGFEELEWYYVNWMLDSIDGDEDDMFTEDLAELSYS